MMALETENKTYKDNIQSLLADEGKYVVIFGTEIVGTFDGYEDALKQGYAKAKLEPFLVKKISGAETIAYFTRDLLSECHSKQ